MNLENRGKYYLTNFVRKCEITGLAIFGRYTKKAEVVVYLGHRYETFTDYVFDEAGHTMAVGSSKEILLFAFRDLEDELNTIKLSKDQVEYYIQPTSETMPIETVFDIYQL